MKYFYIIIAILLISCNKDNSVFKTITIAYDSQDNLVTINNKEPIKSWNLENDTPTNNDVSVKHSFQNNTITIHAIYAIKYCQPSNFLKSKTTINYKENKVIIHYPKLKTHISDKDLFNFKLDVFLNNLNSKK